MQIQVLSEYNNLALEGRVEQLSCPLHKEDEPAIFPLMHSLKDEKIVLHCLACNATFNVGQQLYDNIVKKIEEVKNGISSEIR